MCGQILFRASSEEIRKHADESSIPWLDDAFIDGVVYDRPQDLSEMTDLVRSRTARLSEAARDPASAGVITYGMTLFVSLSENRLTKMPDIS